MKPKELTNQGAGKKRGSTVKADPEPRVLWKASLRIGNRKDLFLYRSGEEFELAATTAEQLLRQSTAATMVGAVIIGIERQARLWN
jgi:thiamine monophosphate kinase